MKKLFLAISVVSFFVACNDAKTDSSTVKDSTTLTTDTSLVTKRVTDTIKVDTSASKMSVDTLKK